MYSKKRLPLVDFPLLSLVFVLNHASPDDFQPLSLREMHNELAANFEGAKVNIAGMSMIKQYYSAIEYKCSIIEYVFMWYIHVRIFGGRRGN